MKQKRNRTLSLAMSFVLVLSLVIGTGLTAFAEDGETPACAHEAGTHNAACGFAEAMEGVPCGNAETDQDCTHEECGYVKAVEKQPCTHTVHDTECGGLAEEQPDEPAPVATATITGFEALGLEHTPKIVDVDTPLEDIKFPESLNATLLPAVVEGEEGTEPQPAATTVAVSGWTCTNADGYQPGVKGLYTFAPTLILGEGVALGEGVNAPAIYVTVGQPQIAAMSLTNEIEIDVTDYTAIVVGASGTITYDPIQGGEYTSFTPADDTLVFTGGDQVTARTIKFEGTGNVNVKMDGLTLSAGNSSLFGGNIAPFHVSGSVTATVTLVGTNNIDSKFRGDDGATAAVQVDGNAAIIIQGEGTLNATSNGSGAGIGGAGAAGANAGTITIKSGTITAYGYDGSNAAKGASAGIGTGSANATYVAINILGGNVTAYATTTTNGIAAGIGCGGTTSSGSNHYTAGPITIKNATVTAASGTSSGVCYGAGIGAGGTSSTTPGSPRAGNVVGGIMIENSTVNAYSNAGSGIGYGAGIGSGGASVGIGILGTVDTISIKNSTVEAASAKSTGDGYGAGIGLGGGGSGGSIGTITINGATVLAYSSDSANESFGAGIGGGGVNTTGATGGAGGTITIEGKSTVEAYSNAGSGRSYGAGIGGGGSGYYGSAGAAGTITLTGSTVKAASAADAGTGEGAGIGGGGIHATSNSSGSPSTGGTIIIDGGEVTAYASNSGTGSGAGIGAGGKGSFGTITIKDGIVTAYSSFTARGAGNGIGGASGGDMGGVITIEGGTVVAFAGSTSGDFGIGTPRYGDGTGDKITITGGSVLARGRPSSPSHGFAPMPTDAAGGVLHSITITMGSYKETLVTALTMPDTYNLGTMKTDADAKVYLWLPLGNKQNVTATVAGKKLEPKDGRFTVNNTDTGSATMVVYSTLTVVGGTNSGRYYGGQEVTIYANDAPAGQVFAKWTATAGTFSTETNTRTVFTMPDSDATVTATYRDEGGGDPNAPVFTTNLPLYSSPGTDDGSYTLTAEATNATGYRWYKDGNLLSSTTGTSLVVHKADGNGKYHVVATNGTTDVQSRTCTVQWGIYKGSVIIDVEAAQGTPGVQISSPIALMNAALTDADRTLLGNDPNVRFEIVLKIEQAGENSTAKQLAEKEGYTVGQYLEITVAKERFDSGAGQGATDVNNLPGGIRIVFTVPENLRATGRIFAVVRVHESVATWLPDLDAEANTITVETDRLSPYTLVYKDTAVHTNDTTAATASPQTGDGNNMIVWIALLVLALVAMAVGRYIIIKGKKPMKTEK